LVEKATNGVKSRAVLVSEGEKLFSLFAIRNPGRNGIGDGDFGYVTALMADANGMKSLTCSLATR